MGKWAKIRDPVAICPKCDSTVDNSIVKVIYRVRCELAGARVVFDATQKKVEELSTRMDNIVHAQQELEEKLYRE